MSEQSNTRRYIDYFRQLAVRHKDIRHDPASEMGGDAGTKKFTRWGADEVITGLRATIGYPALLLELYELDLEAQSVYDVKQYPKGALTVLDHAGLNDFAEEERAFADTERILFDLLRQIWQDHYGPDKDRCTTPFKQFHFHKDNIVPVGPLFDGCKFGWRIEFDFEFQQLIDIKQAPAPGTFEDPQL